LQLITDATGESRVQEEKPILNRVGPKPTRFFRHLNPMSCTPTQPNDNRLNAGMAEEGGFRVSICIRHFTQP